MKTPSRSPIQGRYKQSTCAPHAFAKRSPPSQLVHAPFIIARSLRPLKSQQAVKRAHCAPSPLRAIRQASTCTSSRTRLCRSPQLPTSPRYSPRAPDDSEAGGTHRTSSLLSSLGHGHTSTLTNPLRPLSPNRTPAHPPLPPDQPPSQQRRPHLSCPLPLYPTIDLYALRC